MTNQVISNPYHLEVITNMIKHEKFFQRVPVFYIVNRVKQMFGDCHYRDPELHEALTKQIDDLCYSLGH